jgi:hypothetical protein
MKILNILTFYQNIINSKKVNEGVGRFGWKVGVAMMNQLIDGHP